jgi:hypothetical protein
MSTAIVSPDNAVDYLRQRATGSSSSSDGEEDLIDPAALYDTAASTSQDGEASDAISTGAYTDDVDAWDRFTGGGGCVDLSQWTVSIDKVEPRRDGW